MAAKTPAKPATKASTKAKTATALKATAPRGKTSPRKSAKPKQAKPEPPVIEPSKPELSPEDELLASMDPRHVLFVEHYLIELNATRAYKAAFDPAMRENVAGACASRLLGTANVRKLLACRVKAMFDRSESLQDRMLAQQFAVAFADPNELVEHRREACRFCHGLDHKYQFTPRGLEDQMVKWKQEVREALNAKEDPPEWDELGGTGFDPRREPHEDCPECFGEGVARVVMKDTRDLSPAAKALYASAKHGKDGIEIVMHSQEKARDVLLKILKLYDDKAEVILGVVPQEKLDELYASAFEQAMKGREKVQGRRLDATQEGAQ